jgi:hypothetical protein
VLSSVARVADTLRTSRSRRPSGSRCSWRSPSRQAARLLLCPRHRSSAGGGLTPQGARRRQASASNENIVYWINFHEYHHVSCETEDDPHSPHHVGFWAVQTQDSSARLVTTREGVERLFSTERLAKSFRNNLVWLRNRQLEIKLAEHAFWALLGPSAVFWIVSVRPLPCSRPRLHPCVRAARDRGARGAAVDPHDDALPRDPPDKLRRTPLGVPARHDVPPAARG